MFDWFAWWMNLLQGIVVSLIGGIILLYIILPRMGAKTATLTLKAAKKDPEIAPIINKLQEIIHVLEPLVKQFKNFDLEKTQKDLQPIIETIKKVDPKDVEELMQSLKELTGTIKKSIEKPKIPKPDS